MPAQESPAPAPPSPVATESAAPTPAPLVPAGVIPSQITIDVTGAPSDGTMMYAQMRAAIERAIRPTLHPGAAIRYGVVVPWPIPPLAAGSRAAATIAVSLSGDASSIPVNGTVTVVFNNVLVPALAPRVLYLSDDPEYLQSEGLVTQGVVRADQPARLYYYHSNIGLPRALDVVLTANGPARVHLIAAEAGPDLDVMSVGHTVSREIVRSELGNQGIVATLTPGVPFVVRHALLLQGEVVAGAVDLNLVDGNPVTVSVVAAPAGTRPEGYLKGPRVAYDGHRRHGVFDLRNFGAYAQTYTVGGNDVSVQYGSRDSAPPNVFASDDGRDLGNYGVVHRLQFTLVNPTDAPRLVYLYEKPLGGPLRSSFFVDGQLKELGCVRLPQRYAVWTYQLAPQSTGTSTVLTMSDGGSFFPVEFGVTDTPPAPYTPPVGSPDGCSPSVAPFADPTPVARR